MPAHGRQTGEQQVRGQAQKGLRLHAEQQRAQPLQLASSCQLWRGEEGVEAIHLSVMGERRLYSRCCWETLCPR